MREGSGRDLAERAERAFGWFTLALALVAGYQVFGVAGRLGIFVGYSQTALLLQILFLAVALSVMTAVVAIMHSSDRGSGSTMSRRLALLISLALMVEVLRIVLWRAVPG